MCEGDRKVKARVLAGSRRYIVESTIDSKNAILTEAANNKNVQSTDSQQLKNC